MDATMQNSSLATRSLHTLTPQEAAGLISSGALTLVIHMPSLGAHAGEMRISLSNGHRVVKSVALPSKSAPKPAPKPTPSSTDNVVVVAQTASPAPRKPKAARKGYRWQDFVGYARKQGLSMGDAAKLWNGNNLRDKGRTLCEDAVQQYSTPVQSETVHVKETPSPRRPTFAPTVTTDVDKRTNKRTARKETQAAQTTMESRIIRIENAIIALAARK